MNKFLEIFIFMVAVCFFGWFSGVISEVLPVGSLIKVIFFFVLFLILMFCFLLKPKNKDAFFRIVGSSFFLLGAISLSALILYGVFFIIAIF